MVIEKIEAIGFVEAIRAHAEDDFWGGEEACITLTDKFTAEALEGLSDFSHVEVLYRFHEEFFAAPTCSPTGLVA
jgi:tRNA (Thr-GGU) A37 N-methylase